MPNATRPVPPLRRVACTCTLAPVRRRVAAPCPACQAWERQRVLLCDGTLLPKAQWLLAQTPPEEGLHG
jgi:hypothetical protein